jgi:hypothetical protein
MNALRYAAYGLLAVASLFLSPAYATSFSTDHSDLWWNPNESGWGLQVVQTGSVIFVTMFVYDQNGNPIWYTATGHSLRAFVWTGDLYQTSGPWFGTAPFNPGAITLTKVGTLTFDVSPPTGSVYSGNLTYSVNGVIVTKRIQRQTLTFDNFGGTYQGMFKQVLTCTDPAKSGTFDVPVTVIITHGGGTTFTMVWTDQSATCTFPGTYEQYGRLGLVQTQNYSCTDGTAGTFHLFEMYVNITGFSSRGDFHNQSCSATFHLGGVLK